MDNCRSTGGALAARVSWPKIPPQHPTHRELGPRTDRHRGYPGCVEPAGDDLGKNVTSAGVRTTWTCGCGFNACHDRLADRRPFAGAAATRPVGLDAAPATRGATRVGTLPLAWHLPRMLRQRAALPRSRHGSLQRKKETASSTRSRKWVLPAKQP